MHRFISCRRHAVLALAAPLLAACQALQPLTIGERAAAQVRDTELAFARTLADRDFTAFQRFIADDAVFIDGPDSLQGRSQVAARWSRYFTAPAAPFSWSPDRVEVLASGSLALSSGPVRNAEGRLIGRFTSVWRQEEPGVWRIVFDRGDPVEGH